MTLTTHLETHNFFQALSSVQAQTGVLALQNQAGGVRLCLHLRDANIQAVFFNGRPLRCGEDLRKGLSIAVSELLAQAPQPAAPKGFLQQMWQRFVHA